LHRDIVTLQQHKVMNADERSVNGDEEELSLDTVEVLDVDELCGDASDDAW